MKKYREINQDEFADFKMVETGSKSQDNNPMSEYNLSRRYFPFKMAKKRHRPTPEAQYAKDPYILPPFPTAPPMSPPNRHDGVYPMMHLPPLPVSACHIQPSSTSSNLPDQIARFNLKNPEKMGKRHNPQLYTKRGCTDVCCCFLFFVFLAGWAVVAALGMAWGDPQRLIFPTDSEFRRCGGSQDGLYNFTNRPYLLYFDLTKCISYATALGGCQTTQICVEECPSTYFSYLQLQSVSTSELQNQVKKNLYCVDSIDKTTITSFAILKSLVQSQKCVSYTVKSIPVLQRCFPQAIFSAADTINTALNASNSLDVLRSTFGDDGTIPNDTMITGQGSQVIKQVVEDQPVFHKIVHDLSQTWWQTLTLIIAAGVFAFIWTVIMRLLGSLIIWLSILIVIVALGFGTGYSWNKWNNLKTAGATDDYSFHPAFEAYFEMPTTWFVVAIICSVFLVIFLLIILFIRKRISIACALITESSKAIGSMMSTLLFPIIPFILHIGVFALWGSIAIWLASSGEEICRMKETNGSVTNTSTICNCNLNISGCTYVGIEKDSDRIFWLQLYNLFGFFWLSCFVTALGDIALAGAFASYYWARDKNRDVPTFPVYRALTRALRYNLGSIAFGSLIIAIVKIIRVILEYIDNKLGKSKNQAVKWFLLCLKCCFWCLEVFFKFLTKNAYIMIAIYGKNFFTSAKDSFLLITRNIVRTVVVHKVAGILLFLGKAMITIGMGIVSYYYFSGKWVVDGVPQVDLYYYFVPIIIVVIGSYFMADLFFDVYEMAVDTTFICFLEDSEQNNGSPDRPYYMSERLLEILGNRNEIPLTK
ncbi:unnamed protein product [Caenorhabditis angaria]|uniref:Uncharacterized protein n=1 Tax=Caenorhabditis angaria TaxID=860376 RepID=A0A9P1J2M2_9PELO|nr:unnamed protein product [Caenorhabditis angaria]